MMLQQRRMNQHLARLGLRVRQLEHECPDVAAARSRPNVEARQHSEATARQATSTGGGHA